MALVLCPMSCILSPPHSSPPTTSLREWNRAIKHQVLEGKLAGAILLYTKMQETVLSGDNFTFPLLLKAAGNLGSPQLGLALHGQTVKTGFSIHVFVQTALLNMYSNLGYVESSRTVFDNIQWKDIVAWNSMLRRYASCGQMDNAEELYHLMPCRDQLSFNIMISGYASMGNVECTRRMFDAVPTKDVVSWNSVILACTKAGDMELARKLFDEMQERSVVSWNTMISGYLQSQRYADAVDMFNSMKTGNIVPNHLTLKIVLSACAHLGSLETGLKIHAHAMILEPDAHVVTALIDMYSKCGSIERALEVFYKSEMREWDIYCWNAMISGLALHGYGQAALRLFDDMKDRHIRPDDITFVALLSACSHAGLVEEGYQIFESMEDFGVLPKMEHYACMVDLLGRAGLLDLAYSFMKVMPFEPGATVLGALLSSCLVHGDAELAETVSKHIIDKVGCLSDGEYMMLSNMFALHGRWKEADDWRRMMKEAGISKVAGCSTIEVNGRMYRFLAGDREGG